MKSLLHAPVFKISLAFLLGIICGRMAAWATMGIGLVGLLVWLLLLWQDRHWLGKRWEGISSIALLCTWLGLGAAYDTAYHWQAQVPQLEAYEGQEVQMVGHLVAPVKENQYGKRSWLELSLIRQDNQWIGIKGRCLLYIKPHMADSLLAKHDSVFVSAWLKPVKSKYPGYLKYLEAQGITLAAQAKTLVRGSAHRSLAYHAEQAQASLSQQMGGLIADPQIAGIAQAMFLGDKQNLDPAVREAFAGAGISHILAISGLHVGIILVFLQLLLQPLQRLPHGRRWQALFTLILLLGYVLLTGASPAVVRAGAMFALMLLFRIFRLRYAFLNLLAVTALMQILWRPGVVFDLGFQLSYAAVCGIVILVPWLQKQLYSSHWLACKLWEWVCVSLAATLFTLPLVLLHFGKFPTYFLFSNLLVSFLATATVVVGFATVMLSAIPFLGAGLGWLCEQLLFAMKVVAESVVSLPQSVLSPQDQSPIGWLMIILQLGLLVGIAWATQTRKRALSMPLPAPSLSLFP